MIVAIPTLEFNNLLRLVDQINNSDVSFVKKILVFNNSAVELEAAVDLYKIFNFGENKGVNFCWNIALKQAQNLRQDLLLLNDDVIIQPDFFNKLSQALDQNPNYHVFCPKTVDKLSTLTEQLHQCQPAQKFEGNHFTGRGRYSIMTRREGWAFVISRNALRLIPPIPERLAIFFGDDWIWRFTGGKWIRDNYNLIYHKVGGTTKDHPELRAKLNAERSIFHEELKKICNGDDEY